MTYHLNSADIAPPTPLGQSAWMRVQLPEPAGHCFSDSVHLDAGLHLIYSDYTPSRDLRETSALERDSTALTLTVALEGQSTTIDTDGQHFDFLAGHSTLAAFASLRGERRFAAHQPIRQLRLIAEAPFLYRYGLDSLIQGTTNDHTARRLWCGPHTAATQRLAESLVHLHARQGTLINVHIAALSLLSEQTRTLLPTAAQANDTAIRTHDEEKMQRVHDILLQQFDRPLTLAYLCMAVGTNEYKLKQGFRAVFGTSVHRRLTDIRMQTAWELLETGLPAATVAYRVGYQHPASFSTAFARYYGRVPKSVGGG